MTGTTDPPHADPDPLVRPARAEVVAENNGWSVFIPGLPIAADGASLDEALDETVLALRDYAQAWSQRLRLVPNHAENWGLIQVVEFSTDDELKEWLRAQLLAPTFTGWPHDLHQILTSLHNLTDPG